LGHALRGDAVEEAIDIALGTTRLVPRVPVDRAAVDTTEQTLGIAPDRRPVYAYVGDLKPSLGTVGLVVERSWCRALTGVTRCDSGGLGGRRGAFNALDEGEALAALRHLSFDEQTLPSWDTEFAQEVRRSYPATAAYVDGAHRT
jgi:hypothetical protein